MNRRTLLTAPILAIPPLLGAANPHLRRPYNLELWLRSELYFGTGRPGGEVSDEEFLGFVDREITPRFPDGLTLMTGYGQYLNSQGVLARERSKILILFHPAANGDDARKIEEIREAYKSAFAQESVLRVQEYANVSF
jgi:hypothetical protein